MRLLLDVAYSNDTRPQQGMFCLFFRRDGSLTAWLGSDGSWKSTDLTGIDHKVQSSKTPYVVEAAIPWSALGLAGAPTDSLLAATIEMQDRRENTTLTERIPDARLDESWTWMDFRLLPNPEINVIKTISNQNQTGSDITILPASLCGLPLAIIRDRQSNGTVRVRKIIYKR